jgi:long-chain fatty acid transport protein
MPGNIGINYLRSNYCVRTIWILLLALNSLYGKQRLFFCRSHGVLYSCIISRSYGKSWRMSPYHKRILHLFCKKAVSGCISLKCGNHSILAFDRFVFICAISLAIQWETRAEGFRNSPAGAFSLGRAGGRIAHIDDASAATHNPANLSLLSQPEVSIDPTFVYFGVKYDNGAAKSYTIDPWKILPNLHAAVPLQNTNFILGMGVTVPYGLSVIWEKNGPLRYTTPHFNELQTLNANPSLAMKIGERVSLGVGFDAMWSKLKMRQFYPWSLVLTNPALPDGEVEASGDGVGWGGNIGISVQISQSHRAALTFRSPIDVGYSGDYHLSGVPSGLSGIFPPAGSFDSDIGFPTIVGVGYGINITPKFQIETDFEWLEFSRFDRLPLNLGNPIPGVPPQFTQNWRNTFTAGIGGEWNFHPQWSLRSSYQFYRTPVPDATFSPSIPDSDQHALTLGMAYSSHHHVVEAAYSRVFYLDRNINVSSAFDGHYSMDVHLISMSYHYRF